MPLGSFRLNSLSRKLAALTYRPVTLVSVGESGVGSGFSVSTTDSKFGGASAYSNGSNKYITLSDIPLGSGDWTIECWFKATNTTGNKTLIDFRASNGVANQVKPWIYVNGTKVYYYVNGAVRAQTTYYNINTTTWYHLAVVRYNGTVTMYLQGYYDTPASSQYSDSNNYGTGPSVIGVNASRVGQNGIVQDDDFTGYIDEVRISNIARYTSTFLGATPSAAFTNDDNTLFLMHSDGSNGSTTFTDDNTPPPEYWFNEVTDTGTTDTQIFNSVIDSSGNIYASGNGYASERGIIFKWSKYGILEWKKVITSNYALRKCALDSSGNLYVIGANETINPSKALLIKINSSGSIVWQKNIDHDTSYSAGSWAITIDSSDNIFIAGRYNLNSNDDWRLHIEKFNTSGTIVSSISYQSPQTGYFYINDITTDTSGNIWVVGHYGSSSNYNFILKLSSTGSFISATTLTTSNNANANSNNSISTDSSGNAYVIGYHYSSAVGKYVSHILKVDSSLNLQWQRSIGSQTFYFDVSAIATDSSGNSYIALSYPNTTTSQVILAKYNSSGSIQWQRYIDAPNRQISYGIKLKDNFIVVSGSTNTVSASDENILLWKLPTDGSKTGTYVNSYGTYTYAVSTESESALSRVLNSITFTPTTKSWTASNSSASFTDISGASQTVNIP